MTRRALEGEDPDRLYTVTGGRSRARGTGIDLVTLVISEGEPEPGTQSEYAKILRLCRYPTAVVEVSAQLRLPVSVVKILVSDLLARRQVSLRHPTSGRASATRQLPDAAFLKKVLVGLHNL